MPDAATGVSRHVELAGCCNFRDLGGYAARDGRRSRWRRLFRSDGLTQLTGDDLAILARLGITSVIDLRTPLEVRTRGRFDQPGVAYYHLPLSDSLPGAEQAPAWHDAAFVAARYRRMVAEGASALRQVLHLLADPATYPAVFHCSVGKDRTGVLAAVVLGLLGVPDEVIVWDFTLSRRPMHELADRLRRQYADNADVVEQFVPVVLAVEPAAMSGFIAGVYEEYGSFEGLAGAVGAASAVEPMRRLLLEDAG